MCSTRSCRVTTGGRLKFRRAPRMILRHLAISKYFRHVFLSSELGADKPDPWIYERALRRGLAPNEVLHVGDGERDWAAASSAGLEVFRLKRPQNSLRDLMSLLL